MCSDPEFKPLIFGNKKPGTWPGLLVEALSRGLTTVRQPSIEKGRRAGELLHSPPRSGLPVVEVLDTEVVRGRTSGPPA